MALGHGRDVFELLTRMLFSRVYYQYLGQTWSEKFAKLQAHLDGMINKANSQIASLQNKCSGKRNPPPNLKPIFADSFI